MYINIFLFLVYINCSKTLRTYSECNNYLNSIDIICNIIIKNLNGKDICDKSEIKDSSSETNIPLECYNKEYNLNLLVANSNIPLRQKLSIFLENIMNLDLPIINNDNLLKKYNKEIEECLSSFIKYQQICNFKKNIEDRDKQICKILKKKNNSKFCNKINRTLDNKINSLNKDNNFIFYQNIELDFGSNNYLSIEQNNKDSNNIQNDSFDYENTKVDVNKSYFNNENNKNYDNELENYYINSRKDCIEYGLKSLKEDIIVCTKYE